MKRSELLAAAQEVEEFAEELLHERGGHQGARGSVDAMFQLVALARHVAELKSVGTRTTHLPGHVFIEEPLFTLPLED